MICLFSFQQSLELSIYSFHSGFVQDFENIEGDCTSVNYWKLEHPSFLGLHFCPHAFRFQA